MGEMMPVSGKVPRDKELFPFAIFDEQTARRNHGGQSLHRLAERGGLSWDEAAAIVERRPWFAMQQCYAEEIVRNAAQRLAEKDQTNEPG